MNDEAARRPLNEFLEVARANLDDELRRHRSRPFPSDVEKGENIAFIEPVMADVDLFGWAATVAGGGELVDEDLNRLASLRNDVLRTLDSLPLEARRTSGISQTPPLMRT